MTTAEHVRGPRRVGRVPGADAHMFADALRRTLADARRRLCEHGPNCQTCTPDDTETGE